jgi:hypothetical protein
MNSSLTDIMFKFICLKVVIRKSKDESFISYET